MLFPITEALLDMHQAAALLRVSIPRIYALTTSGCNGVVLESRQVAGKRFTSVQACERFSDALSQPEKVKLTKERILARRKPKRQSRKLSRKS